AAGTTPVPVKMPMPKYPQGVSTKLGPLEVPVAQLPPPLPPKLPIPVDNVCPDNPAKCPPAGSGPTTNGNPGKPSGSGPVVILVPQAPVQVPVAVPVAVPVRVATGTSSVVAAQARPSITPQCGAAANIPALAAGIDELLPTAQLSEADMTKVTELRQMIQVLSADGKVPAARDVEEIAMNLLGYQKVWLRCGLEIGRA